MPANEEASFPVAEVAGAHGLRGEFRIRPLTAHPERILVLEEVRVAREDALVRIAVERVRRQGRGIVLKLVGVDSAEAATELRGATLLADGDWLLPLPDGEYYHRDLLGMQVVTEQGEDLGRIVSIIETGANDVYETRDALIPATREYVLDVDLGMRRMTVCSRPGLRKDDPGT